MNEKLFRQHKMTIFAYMYMIATVLCASTAKDITREVCLQRTLTFATSENKCGFSKSRADTFFKYDYNQCNKKCSLQIKDLYNDTYSLRRIVLTYGNETITLEICTEPTKNHERYIHFNCSLWKQDEVAIREGRDCQNINANCSSIVNTCICQCKSGYFAVNGHCEREKVAVGSACIADKQCTGSNLSGICREGSCKCQSPYIQIQNECYPENLTLGESCQFTEQCTKPNTVCLGGKCNCVPGFSAFNPAYCLVGNISVNQPCSFNDQCLGFPSAVCLGGTCNCIDGYTSENLGPCVKHSQPGVFGVILGTSFGGLFLLLLAIVFVFVINKKYHSVHRHQRANPGIVIADGVYSVARASEHHRYANFVRHNDQRETSVAVSTNTTDEPPDESILSTASTERENEHIYNHLHVIDEVYDSNNYDHASIGHVNDYNGGEDGITESQNADVENYSVVSKIKL